MLVMKLLTVWAVLLAFSLITAYECPDGIFDKFEEVPKTVFTIKKCEAGITVCHIKEHYPIRDGVEYHEEEWGCGPCVELDGELVADCSEYDTRVH